MKRYKRGTISLGPGCNNRCIFCFYADERGKPDLSTEEAFAEIERARHFIFGDLLTFSGGEPTIRADLTALCARALRVGFRGVNLQTNGRALADRKLTDALVRSGLVACFVSLHANTPKLYRRLTGASDGFAQVMLGLRNLEAARVPFTVNVVITRHNYNVLKEIYQLLRKNFDGFRSLRLSFPRITGAALANFDRVVPRFGSIAPFVRQVIAMAKRDGVEVRCDQIPTCVLTPHGECDIAREREPFYIADSAEAGPLGLEYSMKYDFCAECAAVRFCCGVPLEYARRFTYRPELKAISKL